MREAPSRRWTVGHEDEGRRLDDFLCRHAPGVSRGSVRRLLQKPATVLVDGRAPAKGLRLREGQQVIVIGIDLVPGPIAQPEQPLELIAVTDDYVVINKPPGMPCHPLDPGELGTVANALVARYPECAQASPQPREGGMVHRLDHPTSGVLIAARTIAAYNELRQRFTRGEVDKHYLALVAGFVERASVIELPLAPVPGHRHRMQALPADILSPGQPARTEVTPLRRIGAYSLVEIACCSGVRHQIRAHMAAVGHPLAGDTLYGGPHLEGLAGAFLHACNVAWPGASYAAAIPPSRQRLLDQLS